MLLVGGRERKPEYPEKNPQLVRQNAFAPTVGYLPLVLEERSHAMGMLQATYHSCLRSAATLWACCRLPTPRA
ncbi:hypothetical protein DPMN_024328 [Dreissena polymorpha]|uniref:Uncharacterized protein n=1 Tax=Dreissena polymorpha TaxID=45954 RepID=A0A9D4LNQ0_DREPO|nr:hypothetical protein DPMN_024328 [Dreissena polymorpha]